MGPSSSARTFPRNTTKTDGEDNLDNLPPYRPWAIPAFYLTGQRSPPTWLTDSAVAVTLVAFRLDGQRGQLRTVYLPGVVRKVQEAREILQQQELEQRTGRVVGDCRLLLVRYRDGRIEELDGHGHEDEEQQPP
jgi:hypothetical protein